MRNIIDSQNILKLQHNAAVLTGYSDFVEFNPPFSGQRRGGRGQAARGSYVPRQI